MQNVHTNVIVGKEVTHAFFSVPHTKSFWLGCSTGGCQGLKSVQDFPEDFDGIVTGAPVADWNHLMDWSGNFFLITGPSSAPTMCDGIDGVTDEIIEDPNLCLICRPGQDNTTCITTTQAETIKKVFSPFFIDGKLAFPCYQPRFVSITSALLISGAVFPFTARELPPDLSGRTGSILSFSTIPTSTSIHSMNPPLPSLNNLIPSTYPHSKETSELSKTVMHYYNIVSDTMNLHPSQLDDFYHFFHVSGMGHCSGGNGAWEIGQMLPGMANTVTLGSPSLDPEKNVLMAMVQWVEEGITPDTVLGTKFVNNNPAGDIAGS
ncbi:hypothetical protein D9758_015922 [Tetrapyrgos nigripes]|uniref:Carboxylic ester hydrolase n=1 Tax=Tetrapyrgos nigripes TaxID=182062 RepID=A0A8H5CKZ9_9AGAR|nr:hypothetical protein D9758_015922 [Tetrapyrgos nigripes]